MPAPSSAAARPSRELIPADSPLAPCLSVDPERLHGEPCFKGTRVPVQALFDLMQDGGSLEEFVAGFEPVTREQAAAVVRLAADGHRQCESPIE